MTELTHYKRYKKMYQAYYQAHKTRIQEQIRQWATNHPERIKEFSRRWSEEHPERKKEINQKNLEHHRECGRKWRQKHPEKVKAHRLMANLDKYPLDKECEFCGRTWSLEHGHIDYNYPEIYLTVCHACNCNMEVS